MAPEILRGEQPTDVSDFYSIGVLMYFMLTGNPLELGKNALVSIKERDISEGTMKQLIPHVSEDCL
jgi:serine/threonine protein kinase